MICTQALVSNGDQLFAQGLDSWVANIGVRWLKKSQFYLRAETRHITN